MERIRYAIRRIMLRYPVLVTVFVAATIILFISLPSGGSGATRWSSNGEKIGVDTQYGVVRKIKDTTSEIGRASNATLGFSKVYVLSIKDRTDKRDMINLASSLTGFNIEFWDGHKGEEVSLRARPPGVALQDGALGCWRGHLDIIAHVVQNKIPSAFIMEDDADWDIRLLEQLPEFAKGIRTLAGVPLNKKQNSPYGDDWDVVWPGHCGDYMLEKDTRKYIIHDDPTVCPKSKQTNMLELKNHPEKTRIVHRAGAPICAFGYGISYRGAQKILYALGVVGGSNLAIDNGMAFLCRDGFMDMKCYSVEPMLIYHHRPAGSVAKDSDINSNEPTIIREKGLTDNILLSARLNTEQMILQKQNWVTQDGMDQYGVWKPE